MTTVYRPILKTAWQILWRAKYLWFFGFFAAFLASSGEFNLIINNFSDINTDAGVLNNISQAYNNGLIGNFLSNLGKMLGNFSWQTAVLVAMLVFLFLFFLWLSAVAYGGLLAGSYREYRKQPSDFGSTFKTGKQNFWRVFGLSVLSKIVVYGALIILSAPLFFVYIKTTSSVWQFIFILLSFIILIPVAVIISFLTKYALMFVVLKRERFWQAVSSGWQLFLKNWIVSIEMAILMFMVTVVVGLAMIIAAVVLAIPLAFVLYAVYALNLAGSMLTGVVVALVVVAVVLFWFGATLTTYQITAWVLLFDRLTEAQVFPKLVRIIAEWSEKRKAKKSGTNN